MITTIITSDWHIPFHNKPLIENWLQYVQDTQPDNLVFNGDLLDCLTISSFQRPPGVPQLQDEIDACIVELDKVEAVAPDANKFWLDGNHEQRFERLVMREPGLYGLEALNVSALLGLHRRGIKYLPYMKPLDIKAGDNEKFWLTCVHGNRVSKHAGYAAKNQLVDGGYWNLAVGHTHRLGWFNHTGHTGRRRAIEGGGFFDIDQAHYIKGIANWQNGFIVVRQSHDFIHMTPVECTPEGSFFVDGKHYGA